MKSTFTRNRVSNIFDPETFVKLASFRQMRTEFGYLLCHYWMPATRLTLKITTEQLVPGSEMLLAQKVIERNMAKCDADQCIWREKVLESDSWSTHLVGFSQQRPHESLCIYNRFKQTYRTRPIIGFMASPESEREARNNAFLQLPILNPLLPIPAVPPN